VYLVIAEQSYPQKLAFVYLKDLAELFQEELKSSYGTTGGVDYLSRIETIENSYSFIKFGKSEGRLNLYREGDSQKEEGV
jgi:Regulated-SNARE-like domain